VNRLLAATILLSLAITGCSKDGAGQPVAEGTVPAGQPFEVLAGGGQNPLAQRALDTDLSGTVEDLEVAPDGTAYLLITRGGKARLEQIRPDGTHATINLQDAQDVGRQIAVGPDGSVYVNLHWGDKKDDAIYRIRPDDSRQQVISYNAGAVSPRGRSIGVFSAFTVDTQGRLVFAVEMSAKGHSGVLLRRLEADGAVRTIAGKLTAFDGLAAAEAATPAALHPPASGKALDWATTMAMHVSELTTQSDGTVVMATTDVTSAGDTRTILAVTPAGTMREIAEGASDTAPAASPVPFTREGGVQILGRLRAGISAADGLLGVTTFNKPGTPPAGGRYDWAGQYTDGQRAVLKDGRGFAIRLIRPDGSVTTAAFGARFALHGGYLYVVAKDFGTERLLLGRVKIPS